MKKSLLFAGLAAATLSFAGCNKEADVKGLDGVPYEIVLSDASTRTVNSGMTTKWVEGDALSVKAGKAAFADKNVGTGKAVTFTGYSLGRAFVYSTPAYAIAKLPFQILQTAVGSAIALFLCWGSPRLVALYRKEFGKA